MCNFNFTDEGTEAQTTVIGQWQIQLVSGNVGLESKPNSVSVIGKQFKNSTCYSSCFKMVELIPLQKQAKWIQMKTYINE